MSQLPNYLRAHRKRLALTQADIAYLLGMEDGIKVCRYEAYVHEPKLRAVLAYEAICQKSAAELFAGLYRQIEQEIAERAKVLLLKHSGCKRTLRNERRRQVLERISARKPEEKQK